MRAPNIYRSIEVCMRTGRPVLIEDIDDFLEPSLNPFLKKKINMQVIKNKAFWKFWSLIWKCLCFYLECERISARFRCAQISFVYDVSCCQSSGGMQICRSDFGRLQCYKRRPGSKLDENYFTRKQSGYNHFINFK